MTNEKNDFCFFFSNLGPEELENQFISSTRKKMESNIFVVDIRQQQYVAYHKDVAITTTMFECYVLSKEKRKRKRKSRRSYLLCCCQML